MTKQKVWIDADTGNETDDAYAIVRLLVEPAVEVVGVSSVHFNNADLVVFEKWNQYPTAGIQSAAISQALNEEILRLMGLEHVPHPLGADRQIGRAWGGREPRPSPATDALRDCVARLPLDETLDILCLGALTNIASLVLLEPSVLPRIRCHILGAQYDLARGVWNKSEFNIRNDLNAFDALLDSPAARLAIMPIETARPYTFDRDATYARLDQSVPIQKFLKDRWEETTPQDAERILWDLALVEAYLLPQYATFKDVPTPPENLQRSIHLYAGIDHAALTDDFWQALRVTK